MTVETRLDNKRGCGWRKPGGLYLMSGGLSTGCEAMPVPLVVCPTCHGGIKPARGFTWIDTKALMNHRMSEPGATGCPDTFCPFGGSQGKHGLIWIGGAYYKTPEDWTREAREQGVSRRISAVPKDFKLGETWVLVAHREAIVKTPAAEGVEPEYEAAIFHAFMPTAIEYVVKGDETEDELAKLEKRGITPVKVVRVGEQEEIGFETITPDDEAPVTEAAV